MPISFFEKANNAHFNSLAIIDADGKILGKYRKSHIPDGDGYFEKSSLIELFNPIRKKIVINNIHPKWITLFITNFCSARCEHCFYSKELNNKVEDLNLENLKKIFSSLKKPLHTLRIT